MKKVIPEVNIENLVTGVYGDSQTNYYYRNEKGDERKIEKENHKEINRVSVLESQLTKERQSKGNQNEMKNLQDLFRSGLFAALAICVHNFPEGIATMLSTLHGGIKLGLPLAIAIAAHNILEGVCVALPVYFVTRSPFMAITLSTLSGLAEPLGVLAVMLLNE